MTSRLFLSLRRKARHLRCWGCLAWGRSQRDPRTWSSLLLRSQQARGGEVPLLHVCMLCWTCRMQHHASCHVMGAALRAVCAQTLHNVQLNISLCMHTGIEEVPACAAQTMPCHGRAAAGAQTPACCMFLTHHHLMFVLMPGSSLGM